MAKWEVKDGVSTPADVTAALEGVTEYLARRKTARGFDDEVIRTFDAGRAENLDGVQLRTSHIEALAAALADATQRAEAAEAERDDNYERWNDCQEKRMAAEARVVKLTAKLLQAADALASSIERSERDMELIVQCTADIQATIKENAELTAKLEAARDAVAWCSRADDFLPGAKDQPEWERICAPILADRRAALIGGE